MKQMAASGKPQKTPVAIYLEISCILFPGAVLRLQSFKMRLCWIYLVVWDKIQHLNELKVLIRAEEQRFVRTLFSVCHLPAWHSILFKLRQRLTPPGLYALHTLMVLWEVTDD